jgi:polar amino acid transport system substrate-binding protein
MSRLVALVTLVLALAAPAGAADAPPAARPTSLVVALSLGDSGLQAGVVRGREVILARGFEVELARLLARRLGGRVVRFVDIRPPGRLLAAGAPSWQLAVASIEPTPAARAVAALSAPYLTTDLAVVLRRGLEHPRVLADLRKRLVCVVKGSDALPVVARTIRPVQRPLVASDRARLRTLLRTGACDAAVVPAWHVRTLIAGRRALFGPVAGRIEHGDGLVIAVARGSGLEITDIDRELRRLRADGSLGRLARAWLGLDPAALRWLR